MWFPDWLFERIVRRGPLFRIACWLDRRERKILAALSAVCFGGYIAAIVYAMMETTSGVHAVLLTLAGLAVLCLFLWSLLRD